MFPEILLGIVTVLSIVDICFKYRFNVQIRVYWILALGVVIYSALKLDWIGDLFWRASHPLLPTEQVDFLYKVQNQPKDYCALSIEAQNWTAIVQTELASYDNKSVYLRLKSGPRLILVSASNYFALNDSFRENQALLIAVREMRSGDTIKFSGRLQANSDSCSNYIKYQDTGEEFVVEFRTIEYVNSIEWILQPVVFLAVWSFLALPGLIGIQLWSNRTN